jgi:DNA-binding NarL/FixJ family response regulator
VRDPDYDIRRGAGTSCAARARDRQGVCWARAIREGGDVDEVRVLVVEGDLRTRRALVRLVDAMVGYRVVAESAEPCDAADLARRHAPTVALVDLDTPGGLGGLSLTRELTALGVAVVAMSSASHSRHPSALAGAAAFHDKGGAAATLPEALARVASARGRGDRPAS